MKTEHRIKILDISTHFSGSVASRHLADLGADVVKLENPKLGDGNRGLPPFIEGVGLSHIALNVGKRSVAVDRRSADWAKNLQKCVRWADVVILGSPPAMARKRGLDFMSMKEINDQIVYCNISAYGEIGPWSDNPLHGLNGDVAAGLVPIQMVDGLPVANRQYRSVGTTLAGIHAALGILEAVRRRDLGYGAQQVFCSVWESSVSWQWRDLTAVANTGKEHPSYGDLGPRYAMYETSDRRIILICPIEQKFWIDFCQVLDLPDGWAQIGNWQKSGMDNGADRPEERGVIAAKIKEQTLEYWETVLDDIGIPFSALDQLDEVISRPQAREMRVMASTQVNGKTVQVPNIPIHIGSASDQNFEPRGPSELPAPPILGEHTDDFLKD